VGLVSRTANRPTREPTPHPAKGIALVATAAPPNSAVLRAPSTDLGRARPVPVKLPLEARPLAANQQTPGFRFFSRGRPGETPAASVKPRAALVCERLAGFAGRKRAQYNLKTH